MKTQNRAPREKQENYTHKIYTKKINNDCRRSFSAAKLCNQVYSSTNWQDGSCARKKPEVISKRRHEQSKIEFQINLDISPFVSANL